MLTETFAKVKSASVTLARISDETKNNVLRSLADAVIAHQDDILSMTACNSRPSVCKTSPTTCAMSAPCPHR